MDKQHARRIDKLAAAVLVREAALRVASAAEATFWFEVAEAKNLSVKEYEDPNQGDSGIGGSFVLYGTLHVQPKGAVWSAQFQVNHPMTVAQHAQSGTYVFNPKGHDPVAKLLGMALFDYKVEEAVVKALGKLEFVPWKDRPSPQEQAWAWLTDALKHRRLPTSTGDDRQVAPGEFGLAVPDPVRGQWQFKHHDTRNYVFIDAKNGKMTVPQTTTPFMRGTFDKYGSKQASAIIVGDIFYSSWGYDQTNVDYYQVIKTTPAMITLREIDKRVTRVSGDQEYVMPTANKFTGAAFSKKLQAAYDGRPMIKLNSYSNAYKWDGKEKYQTSSLAGH